MAGRFCTERQLCFVFYTDNEAVIVTIQQPLSREVFWHIYAKIPRHTSKMPLPKVISNTFLLVHVKVLNSYKFSFIVYMYKHIAHLVNYS